MSKTTRPAPPVKKRRKYDDAYKQQALQMLALVNVTRGYAVTRHVAQTPATTKVTGDESRLTWYAQQVVTNSATLPPQVRYRVVEGAYAKRPYMEAVCAAGRHLITKLRSDADCYFLHTAPRQPGQKGRSRKYDGKVNFQDLTRVTCVGPLPDTPGSRGATGTRGTAPFARRFGVPGGGRSLC